MVLLTHFRFEKALIKAREIANITRPMVGVELVVSINPSYEIRRSKDEQLNIAVSRFKEVTDQILVTPRPFEPYEHYYFAAGTVDSEYAMLTADDDNFDYVEMTRILQLMLSQDARIDENIVGFVVTAGLQNREKIIISYEGYCSDDYIKRIHSFLKNPSDLSIYFIHKRINLQMHLYRACQVKWAIIPLRLKNRRIAFLMAIEMLVGDPIRFIGSKQALIEFDLDNGSQINLKNIPFLTFIDIQLIYKIAKIVFGYERFRTQLYLWKAFAKFSYFWIKDHATR